MYFISNIFQKILVKMLSETSLFNIFFIYFVLFLFFFFSIQFYHSGKREAKGKYWKGEEIEQLKSPPQDRSYFQSAAKEFLGKKNSEGVVS